LESAFRDAVVPKKKTRDDIIRGLKESKVVAGSSSTEDKSIDTAKQMGKFRPIGAPVENKQKKRKLKSAEGEEKKRRKVKHEEVTAEAQAKPSQKSSHTETQDIRPPSALRKVKSPSPDFDMDADIFADAGEYVGFDSGSESEDGMTSLPSNQKLGNTGHSQKQNWFGEPETETVPTREALKPVDMSPQSVPEQAKPEPDEEPAPTKRLQGLTSSSVPSVRDILAMDELAEKEEKRKARKEKKKGKKPSDETKLNREVKQ
jgi:IK cytokine